jgi:AbrB family looped-hinge helix DNA binding protein
MDRGTVQIDAAGRLILPKPLRKRFHLSAGDKLRFSADDNGIRLEPIEPGGELVRKGKALVFRGEFAHPITTEMVERLIHEDRTRSALDPNAKPTAK